MASRTNPTVFIHVIYVFSLGCVIQLSFLQDFVIPRGYDPFYSTMQNSICHHQDLYNQGCAFRDANNNNATCTTPPPAYTSTTSSSNSSSSPSNRPHRPLPIEYPPPKIVALLTIASSVILSLGLLIFHYDTYILECDMNRFKVSRNKFFAQLIRLAQQSQSFANSPFWRGDDDDDDGDDDGDAGGSGNGIKLAKELGTTGRGLGDLLAMDPIRDALDEIEVVVGALLPYCKLNGIVFSVPPPVFALSRLQTGVNSVGCLMFTFVAGLLLTGASCVVEKQILESEGRVFLGLGGASLHLVNGSVWLIWALHLINAVDAFRIIQAQYQQGQRNRGAGDPSITLQLSMGELEKIPNGHIFPIAVSSFMVVMNASIYLLCQIEEWSFRWAEQWYFATVTGIGFTTYDVMTDSGKVFSQTLGMYGFLHLATILTLGAGLMLDRLKMRIDYIVARFNQQTQLVERRVVEMTIEEVRKKGQRSFMVFIAHHQLTSVVVMVFSLWLLGTITFAALENWDYIDSSYFAVNILLTEGYSNIYPSQSLGRVFLYYYCLIACGVWACGISIMIDKLQKSKVVVLQHTQNQTISHFVKRRSSLLSPA
ncbi:hypothetical protein BDR26DRAFT_920015 [Obelidium mucronatum]|nr:hypothetical protein BDR26DRAFT_920015 [Obelidium mucronatum]